jgi:hypothetical protein
MINKITIIENILDPQSWETFDCDDVREFLVNYFGIWPKNARIYLNHVCESANITPFDEGGVERLGKLGGHFFVINLPEISATVLLIIAIVLAAASIVMGFLMRPNIPENVQNQSPTNALTSRENRERLGGRIPDIYGQLWTVPDLIMYPYRIFVDNKEVEHCYMCLGRGDYVIANLNNDIRDDITPLIEVGGAACEVYAPYTSPNSGDAPKYRIGAQIRTPISCVRPYTSINGQVLKAPNLGTKDFSIRCHDDGTIEAKAGADFTDYFEAGSVTNPKYLIIACCISPKLGGNQIDYGGTYEILDVSPGWITLSNPGSINSNWNSIDGQTDWFLAVLCLSGESWQGPFKVLDNRTTELWCNFVCEQGLYEMDSSGKQNAVYVTLQIEVTSLDVNGAVQGEPIFYSIDMRGSAEDKSTRGVTLKATLPFAGACQVRARRLTNTDVREGWSVMDEVKWRDLYSVSPIDETEFGNITTVQTVTWPTPSALSLKKRKLNILVDADIVTKIPAISRFEQMSAPQRHCYGVNGPWDPDRGNIDYALAGHKAIPPGYNTQTIPYIPKTIGPGCLLELGPTHPCSSLNGVEKYLQEGDMVNPRLIITDMYVGAGAHYLTCWGDITITGDGTYPGAKQWSKIVSVDGKCMPWNTDFVSGYPFGIKTGIDPVFIPVTAVEESLMIFDVDAGYLVNVGEGHEDCDGAGEPGHLTGTNIDPITGTYYPTKYMGANSLGHGGLVGTWVKFNATTGLYDILGVFALGLGGVITCPAGNPDGLWLGINDIDHADNTGFFQVTLTQYIGPNKLGCCIGCWTDEVGEVIEYLNMSKNNDDAWYRVPAGACKLLAGPNDHWYDDNTGHWVFYVYQYKMYRTPGSITRVPSELLADDILIAMALDPYIGRMTYDELDVEGIRAAITESITYFGTNLCAKFANCFDDPKQSFEEMVSQLSQAAMCTAFRRGKLLSWQFEKATDNSTMLFNHRNILPGSQEINVTFGSPVENDGIDLDYTEPNAPNSPRQDTQMTLHFPADESAVSPRKVTAVGVRNLVQAWMLGWRLYNKFLYQNSVVEFEATAEAALCVINDRLLIADNTRPETSDGEVLAQDGLEITLSQPSGIPASPAPAYTIFLQHYDRTVESIAVYPGSEDNKVILDHAPTIPLVIDSEKYAKTTYILTADATEGRSGAYLMQEKSPKGAGQYTLKCVNYDPRYYSHDGDYLASPRLVNEMSPAGAHAGGYSKQNQITVSVNSRCSPWDTSANPSYPFGKNNGKAPVVVPIQAAEGEEVVILATPGWLVNPARTDGHEWVESNGQESQITGVSQDSNGTYFPTLYASSPVLGHAGLIGAWAHTSSPAGQYLVVQPIVIGWGGTYTVPAGVDCLLLGINDTNFNDNDGEFQVTIIQVGDSAGDYGQADPNPETDTTDPDGDTITFTVNGA